MEIDQQDIRIETLNDAARRLKASVEGRNFSADPTFPPTVREWPEEALARFNESCLELAQFLEYASFCIANPDVEWVEVKHMFPLLKEPTRGTPHLQDPLLNALFANFLELEEP